MAPYGEQWRQLRRIIVTHVLSTRCVQAYRRIREEEAAHVVSALASRPPGQLVNVSALMAQTSSPTRPYVPSSRHADRREVKDGDREKDMIDVLLGLQKEASMRVSLTPEVIKSVVMWTMAELVANPKVMKKAQEEIRRVLVRKERVNEESLRDLHYLRALIKETLRLHPSTAALFPRVCLQDDQKIQGFHVPRGTILVTNIWAICRDPKYWKDPDTFIPERFEDECAFDFKGDVMGRLIR
ncbi:hypothetical protein PR202_ga22059 [Eleusine coracana subsp. coracana]|uniref:Uncharacterized protein n=1 Tax=Eleusine coracana subsp. coracana TaxID=191504 RepID=A0AAV5D2K5_ELECO|nr:hypothetical protein PR202_ga22059 [Eleusine coracana subsp. coracana]